MRLGPYLARWDLVPDGEPIETPSSLLLAVRHNGVPAMLKLAREEEERRGGALMAWWNGDGAAKVLAQHGPALLLERADGPRSLAARSPMGRTTRRAAFSARWPRACIRRAPDRRRNSSP